MSNKHLIEDIYLLAAARGVLRQAAEEIEYCEVTGRPPPTFNQISDCNFIFSNGERCEAEVALTVNSGAHHVLIVFLRDGDRS